MLTVHTLTGGASTMTWVGAAAAARLALKLPIGNARSSTWIAKRIRDCRSSCRRVDAAAGSVAAQDYFFPLFGAYVDHAVPGSPCGATPIRTITPSTYRDHHVVVLCGQPRHRAPVLPLRRQRPDAAAGVSRQSARRLVGFDSCATSGPLRRRQGRTAARIRRRGDRRLHPGSSARLGSVSIAPPRACPRAKRDSIAPLPRRANARYPSGCRAFSFAVGCRAQTTPEVLMSERIGFIGLGVMGKPMARHLLARGFGLVVHSRSRGPVDELVAAGRSGGGHAGRGGACVDDHRDHGAGLAGRRGSARRTRRGVWRAVPRRAWSSITARSRRPSRAVSRSVQPSSDRR